MKRIFRYVISLVLLVAGLACAGLYIVFDLAQYRMKLEARAEIEADSKLEHKTFAKSGLIQSRTEEELWIDGELCDVVSYMERGDSVTIAFYHDVHEETLVEAVGQTFEPFRSTLPDEGMHFLKHKIHFPDNEPQIESYPCFSNSVSQVVALLLVFFQHNYSDPLHDQPSPPPRSRMC